MKPARLLERPDESSLAQHTLYRVRKLAHLRAHGLVIPAWSVGSADFMSLVFRSCPQVMEAYVALWKSLALRQEEPHAWLNQLASLRACLQLTELGGGLSALADQLQLFGQQERCSSVKFSLIGTQREVELQLQSLQLEVVLLLEDRQGMINQMLTLLQRLFEPAVVERFLTLGFGHTHEQGLIWPFVQAWHAYQWLGTIRHKSEQQLQLNLVNPQGHHVSELLSWSGPLVTPSSIIPLKKLQSMMDAIAALEEQLEGRLIYSVAVREEIGELCVYATQSDEHYLIATGRWSSQLLQTRFGPDHAPDPLTWSLYVQAQREGLKNLQKMWQLEINSEEDLLISSEGKVYLHHQRLQLSPHLFSHRSFYLKFFTSYLTEMLGSLVDIPYVYLQGREKKELDFGWFIITRGCESFLFKSVKEIIADWDATLKESVRRAQTAYQLDFSKMSPEDVWVSFECQQTALSCFLRYDLVLVTFEEILKWLLNQVEIEFRKNHILPVPGEENSRSLYQKVLQGNIHNPFWQVAHCSPEEREKKYGYLTASWNLRAPTLAEDSSVYAQILSANFAYEPQPLATPAESYKQYHHFYKQILQRLDQDWTKDFFAKIVYYAREIDRVRSEQLFYYPQFLRGQRRTLDSIEQHLLKRQLLPRLQESHFLSVGELTQLWQGKMLPVPWMLRGRICP